MSDSDSDDGEDSAGDEGQGALADSEGSKEQDKVDEEGERDEEGRAINKAKI
jgi:hypothetical protein